MAVSIVSYVVCRAFVPGPLRSLVCWLLATVQLPINVISSLVELRVRLCEPHASLPFIVGFGIS